MQSCPSISHILERKFGNAQDIIYSKPVTLTNMTFEALYNTHIIQETGNILQILSSSRHNQQHSDGKHGKCNHKTTRINIRESTRIFSSTSAKLSTKFHQKHNKQKTENSQLQGPWTAHCMIHRQHFDAFGKHTARTPAFSSHQSCKILGTSKFIHYSKHNIIHKHKNL